MFNVYRLLQTVSEWFRDSPNGKALLTIADALGKLAILYTIVTYLAEAPQRQKAKEFQAWQVINTARAGEGGRKAALRDLIDDGADLGGIDLSNANLAKADFCNADIPEANFQNANLAGATFSCPPFWWNWWHRAEVHSNVISDSLLSVDFRNSDLYQTNFSGRSLVRPKFANIPPKGGQFEFSDDNFDQAMLYLAQLDGVVFRGSSFVNALISKSTIQNVTFRGTLFTNARITEVEFRNITIESIDLISGSQFENDTIEARRIVGKSTNGRVDFTGTKLIDVRWNGHPVSEKDLVGAIVCRTNIEGQVSNRDCN
jgi:uncharacterized protein YjbI with pentapeptide repeats